MAIDEILSELANGDIEVKDVIKIATSKSDMASTLRSIVDKLGSWESLKDYAKYLAKENIEYSTKSLSSYLGESKK